MRLGTIAFLLGTVLFQQLRNLPDARWCWLAVALPPCLLLAPRARFPIVVLAGLLWASFNAHAIMSTALDPGLEGRDVVIEGVVASPPQRLPHHVGFVFAVRRLSYRGTARAFPARVRLNWYGNPPWLYAGDVWRLKVRLKRPRGYMNPGGFDYEGWLFERHIRATGYVRVDARNRLLDARPYAYGVDRLRQRLGLSVAQTLRDSPYAGIINALAVGDRHGITADQWRVLNATGTTHLMAISGLHVGLVAGILFFAVRRLWAWCVLPWLRWPAPKAAAVIAVAGAVCYAALAGFSIPTQRALIMLTVVMGAVMAQRHFAPSFILCAALSAVLLLDPLAVMSSGLWLSFAAVAVILFAMGGRVAARSAWWKWGRVHAVVTLGLLPLLLVFFQRMSLSAPVANILAVPWVSAAVVPAALSGVALHGILPGLSGLCLRAAAAAFGALWPVLQGLSHMAPAAWLNHRPLGWTLIPAVAGVALLLAPRGLPGRRLGIVLLAPLLLCLPPAPPQGAVWFTLLDVGQGLSAVVRTRSHVLVYDTGPRLSDRFDTGAAVVLPYLHYTGAAAVDILILSHGDNDHIGGLHSILKGIAVRRILTSVPDKIPEQGARRCHAGQAWRWDGVAFRILNPARHARARGNNASCVLRIIDGAGHAILLTGDIERPAERALLDTRRRLAADIMTVPHHGSDTSSSRAFVTAVNPRYALFPVGYRNRYGFPKEDVTERYTAQGAELLTTSGSGAIIFHLGGGREIAPPVEYRRRHHHYWNAY